MHSNANKLSSKIKDHVRKFSTGISKNYPEHEQKFIQEMIFGLLSNQSCRLSEIARALKEKIQLKAVHNRLRRNLQTIALDPAVETYQKSVKCLIDKDTVLSVDPGDLTKRYATKMEHIEYVHDGSAAKREAKTALGYGLIQIVAVTSARQVIPLLLELFSKSVKGFKSRNKTIITAIKKMIGLLGEGVGIFVLDREADAINIIKELLQLRARFIIRMTDKRDLILENDQRVHIKKLVKKMKFDYGNKRLMKLSTKDKQRYEVVMGTQPVRLPGYEEELTLVVLKKVRGKEIRMMLLTTESVTTSVPAFEIIRKYLCRWGVEDAFRYIKQSYDLEDVRVRKYQSLQNMVSFVFLTFGFLCQVQQKRMFQTALAKVVEKARRLFKWCSKYEFVYYALSTGISNVFSACYHGLNRKKAPPNTAIQQLFLPLILDQI